MLFPKCFEFKPFIFDKVSSNLPELTFVQDDVTSIPKLCT